MKQIQKIKIIIIAGLIAFIFLKKGYNFIELNKFLSSDSMDISVNMSMKVGYNEAEEHLLNFQKQQQVHTKLLLITEHISLITMKTVHIIRPETMNLLLSTLTLSLSFIIIV